MKSHLWENGMQFTIFLSDHFGDYLILHISKCVEPYISDSAFALPYLE
jgi:hypothetical protein